MDNLTKTQRSNCMSKISGKNTLPEKQVTRLLRSNGFTFGRHSKNLPGKPDITFRNKRLAIFVHGCYWHQHHCRKGLSTPKSNAAFWRKKRQDTKLRDKANVRALRKLGWKALTVWECQIKREVSLEQRILRFLSK